MKADKPTNIDGYVKGFPKDIQKILEQIRATIGKAAPQAEETISYGIPTYTFNGNLVHFAAFKNHIGFYPSPSAIAAFKKELSIYKGAKGSVQFPHNEPIPYHLIQKIVVFRVNENLNKKSKTKIPKTKPTDQEQVTQHIQKLKPDVAEIVENLRQIILSTDKEIGERIKWNSPSFYYTGEMEEFDPKEYKRDLIVMNLYKDRIMLVFPSGAKVNDRSGLLEGNYKDGRRTTVFKDLNDVKEKQKAFQKVIKEWLGSVDRHTTDDGQKSTSVNSI